MINHRNTNRRQLLKTAGLAASFLPAALMGAQNLPELTAIQ